MRRRRSKTKSALMWLFGAAVIVPRAGTAAEDPRQETPHVQGRGRDADCGKSDHQQPDGGRGKARRPSGEPERKVTAEEH
jgi:hypothetical protein